MSEIPDAPAALPKLTRPLSGRVVAGVAQGAAAQLRLDPVVLRLAFVLLTILNGLGILAYAALWMFTPAQPKEAADKGRDWSQATAYGLLGFAILVIGMITDAVAGGFAMWSLAIGGIGSLILWQQADPMRRQRWMSSTVGQVR